jgi:hypothetical protein
LTDAKLLTAPRLANANIVEGKIADTYTDYLFGKEPQTFSFAEELATIIRTMRKHPDTYCRIRALELTRDDTGFTAKIISVPNSPEATDYIERTTTFAQPLKHRLDLRNYDMPAGEGRNVNFFEDFKRSVDERVERNRVADEGIAYTVRVPGRILRAIAKLFGPAPVVEGDTAFRPVSAFERWPYVGSPPKPPKEHAEPSADPSTGG